MKWIKHNTTLAIALILGATLAIGAGIQQNFPTDILKMGVGSSTDDKEIIIDTGDGASNPKIVIDMTNKDFDFTKAVNVAGDLLSTGNQYTMGDGAASNKIVEFDIGAGANNPKFRWNNTDSSLEFSNDGLNFRRIGSGAGGGGGVNFLGDFNADFEAGDPPNSWSQTGTSTFVAETTNPLFGKQSGKWDPGAASELLNSQLVPLQPGFIGAVGQRCQAEILYKWPTGVSGEIEMVVEDQNPNDILVLPLEPTSGDDTRRAQAMFDCPTTSDSLRLLLRSTADAAEIIVDDAFLGTGKNTFHLSQTSLFAYARFGGDCSWNTSSASILFPVGDSTCTMGAVEGPIVIKTDGNGERPGFTITDAPPGEYEIVWQTTAIWSNDANTHTGRIEVNGINYDALHSGPPGSANDRDSIHIIGRALLTQTGTIDVEWRTGDSGGNNYTTGVGSTNSHFFVRRYPIQKNEALTLASSGWYVAGNIYDTGAGQIALSNANLSTYTTPGGSNLELEIKAGSQPFQIACLGAPAEGTNCNGAAVPEAAGIAVDIPTAGVYRFCMQGRYIADYDNDVYDVTFQLHETDPLGTDAILQAGGGNIGFHRSGLAGSQSFGMNTCGVFNFASSGKKTIKLMREQTFSGAPNGHFIASDRAATLGQRDVFFYGYKINEGIPGFIFTDIQNALNELERNSIFSGADTASIFPGTRIKFCGGEINGPSAGSPCAINRERGDCWSSTSQFSASQCDLFFTGKFSASGDIQCNLTSRSGASGVTTTAEVRVNQNGVAGSTPTRFEVEDTSEPVVVMCIGFEP